MDVMRDSPLARVRIRVQRRLFEILEAPLTNDRLSRAVNRLLVVLIVANIAAVILESVGTFYEKYGAAFQFLEMFSLTIFVVEYLLSSMWWTLETLTMINYDDMAPITPLGRFLGVMIGLMGIGMFAMPAGILASAFIEQLKKRPLEKARCCPKCGAAAESE